MQLEITQTVIAKDYFFQNNQKSGYRLETEKICGIALRCMNHLKEVLIPTSFLGQVQVVLLSGLVASAAASSCTNDCENIFNYCVLCGNFLIFGIVPEHIIRNSCTPRYEHCMLACSY